MAIKPSKIENELAQKRQDKDHERIISEMLEQFKPVFENSPDGVYLYLDDRHKVCNKKMADLFGMSVEEWAAIPDFLGGFVLPQDQELVARNFQEHVASLTRPALIRFQARKKDGTVFTLETEMIPISWDGHPVAYHFVRRVS
jgi:PAS domain S-box-containing protein